MFKHSMILVLFFLRRLLISIFLLVGALASIPKLSAQSEKDSLYLRAIQDKAIYWAEINLDSSFYWARFQLLESRRLEYPRFIATAYNQLGINFARIGRVDSSINSYKIAKSMVPKYGYTSPYTDIIYNEAMLYRQLNQIENAKKLIRESFEIDFHLRYFDLLTYDLVELGNCYIDQDSLSVAIDCFSKAYKLAYHFKDTVHMAGIGINLSSIYIDMKLFAEAENILKQSNYWFEIINNKRGVVFTNTSIANVWIENGKYKEALGLLQGNLGSLNEVDDILLSAMFYECYGEGYYHLQYFDSSLFYYKKSLILRSIKSENGGLSSSYYNIAKTYFKLGDVKSAKFHIDHALNNSEEGNQQMFFYSHRLAAQIDSSMGNYSSAYKHMQEALKYHEAYFNDESKTALLSSKAKLEKEAQVLKVRNDFLAKENLYDKALEQQRTLRTQWIFGSAITVLLLLLIFAYRSRKEQAAKYSLKLKLHNSEMDSLNAQIDTHFIYNTLSTIQHFMYSQRINDAISMLQKFGQLMRNSLSTTRKGAVSLRDELNNLQLYIDLACNKFEKPPKYTLFVDHRIEAEKTIIPPMFIQPLIENAIKHGVSRLALDGNIQLHVLGNDASSIRIQVWDNGPQGYAKTNPVNGLSMSNSILQERLQLYNSKLKTSKFVLQLKTIEASNSTNTVAELILPVLH